MVSSFFRSQASDEDDEINLNAADGLNIKTPLNRFQASKAEKKGIVRYPSWAIKAGLVVFSAIFVGLILLAATYTTAESARLADEGILRNIHTQQHDWSKTKHISGNEKDSPAAVTKVHSLEGKVAHLQAELASLKSRRSSHHMWKKSDDYSEEVERKERAEEHGIEKRAAKLAKESSKVDMEGLDAKHRRVLRQMKDKIKQQDEEARVKGEQDYLRREKEIDSLLPSDTNCPGPQCLISRRPHAAARAAERPPATKGVKVMHRHPPWHRHYPDEFHNVYNSKEMPWLNDVKVAGPSLYSQQGREVAKILAPLSPAAPAAPTPPARRGRARR